MVLVFTSTPFVVCAQSNHAIIYDSINNPIDTIIVKEKTPFLKKAVNGVKSVIKEFNIIDTTYIEPQHFKFTAMLENINTFELYKLADKAGNTITFAPDVRSKIGPYVGYSLIFLGFNIQLNHLYVGNTKKEFDVSLYTSLGGVDLFLRNNGNDFKIKSIDLKSKDNTRDIENTDFDGFRAKSIGISAYYIFNHRKHSYPAAYNQSTCQKISAGSPIIGLGWSRHSVGINWTELDNVFQAKLPELSNPFNASELFDKVEYTCYSVYGGYAYNWVVVKNLLLGASLSAGLAYNHSHSETSSSILPLPFMNFNIHNFCFDGVGRIGVVWNNNRIYAGASAIAHSYRYRKSQFSTNNVFGSVNIYVGFNFGKKAYYRKPGKIFEF